MPQSVTPPPSTNDNPPLPWLLNTVPQSSTLVFLSAESSKQLSLNKPQTNNTSNQKT